MDSFSCLVSFYFVSKNSLVSILIIICCLNNKFRKMKLIFEKATGMEIRDTDKS